jgi:gluconate 2-dehydrogenase gamma chain
MPISPDDLLRLRAAIARIIPTDDTPGALELGTDSYIIARLGAEHAAEASSVWAGLANLEARAGARLAALAAPDLDALLTSVETQPWFTLLVELTGEGFYADPENGGNRHAASWVLIGYEPRMPGEPK